MDDSISDAHSLLGQLYGMKKDYDEAIAEGERAVALNPGGAAVHVRYGNILRYASRPEEAIPIYQKAIRLNPFGSTSNYLNFGYALRDVGRYEEAVPALKKAIQLAPDNIIAHYGLAVTYIWMGREKEARAEAAEVLRINPKFSVESWQRKLHIRINRKQIESLMPCGRRG